MTCTTVTSRSSGASAATRRAEGSLDDASQTSSLWCTAGCRNTSRVHRFGHGSSPSWFGWLGIIEGRWHAGGLARKRAENLKDHRTPGPQERVERAEAVLVLEMLLDSMQDELRDVFILAELEQMSVPEIAQASGTNLNTVYSRLRTARKDFKSRLARQGARWGGKHDRP